MEISKGQINEILYHLEKYWEVLNDFDDFVRQEKVSNLMYQLGQILDSEH